MLPVLSTVFAVLFTLTAALAEPGRGMWSRHLAGYNGAGMPPPQALAEPGRGMWSRHLAGYNGAGMPPPQAQARAAEAEARAAEIRRQLEEIRREVVAFSAEEEALAAQLHEADRALSRERLKAEALRAEADAIDARVTTLEADAAALARRIDRLRGQSGQRLRARYRMSHLDRIDLLITAESFTDLVRQQTALDRVIAHDEATLAALRRETDQRTALLTTLRTEKAEKARLAAARRDQMVEIERAQAERQALLKRVQTDKSAALTAAKSLKQAAKDLDRRIASLHRRAESPPPEKNGAPPFTSVKGSLTMPVRGKIISFFGPRKNTELNVVTFQSGIDIRASHGDPIRAVHSGRVVYSSWLKGYGNVLIIDHGDSYYTVYGHAAAVHKATGETVRAEEVIATVGDTGSLKGPMLHFEIRHHGTPVDPMEWLNHS